MYGWKPPDPVVSAPAVFGRRNAFEREQFDLTGIASLGERASVIFV